jgi:hypothetical protein
VPVALQDCQRARQRSMHWQTTEQGEREDREWERWSHLDRRSRLRLAASFAAFEKEQ